MLADYQRVRRFTERLAANLTPEDATLQSMPDASPAKWHLAHTTWFFETFLVGRYDRELSGHTPIDSAYAVLFNSYYNTVGEQFPRPQRGLISRPGLAEVIDYRKRVDEAVARLDSRGVLGDDAEAHSIVEIGLNHEQQHQELLLTDIKHALSHNPLEPALIEGAFAPTQETAPIEWAPFNGGVHPIGHDGDGFAYDNEGPRHDALVHPFALASRPVTCGEYRNFMADGGYATPTLWLAEGWSTIQAEGWDAPLYWRREPDGAWSEYTLAGRRPIDRSAPVTHVSYFEADAYARWAGGRLPTEFEWEVACERADGRGQRAGFADELLKEGQAIHPQPSAVADGLSAMLGQVWEWTASPYTPYPGYRAAEGALGEYNGKFMVNQQVLRGGSCATSSDHIRPTYRNFFATAARWQFSGIRLARDASV